MKIKMQSAILLFSLSLLFLACNNGDEAEPASLVGTWKAINTDTNYEISVDGSPLSEQEVNFLLALLELQGVDVSILEEEDNATIEFKDDNTYTISDDSGSDSGDYELSSDRKSVTIDDEIVFTIISLTSNTLIIETDFTDTFEDDAGDLVEILIEINAELEKI